MILKRIEAVHIMCMSLPNGPTDHSYIQVRIHMVLSAGEGKLTSEVRG